MTQNMHVHKHVHNQEINKCNWQKYIVLYREYCNNIKEIIKTLKILGFTIDIKSKENILNWSSVDDSIAFSVD